MELSQLKMFKIVAEQGSIIRASELLHCVPSNITARIKHLENEMGVPLFIRKGRGLVISPSGEIFLGYVNKILAMCQEARRALDPESPPSGRLSIGAIESSATGRLPGLLSTFNQHHSSVQLQFSTAAWPQLVDRVVDHRLDAAILATRCEHPDVGYIEIYKEKVVLIASAGMAEIAEPEDLEGQTLFMWPEGCPYRQVLQHWLNKHGVSTSITSIASYGTILGCVRAGAGLSLVPAGVFEQFRGMGNVRGYAFSQLEPVQNYFIWNKNAGLHRARDAFVRLLKTEFNVV